MAEPIDALVVMDDASARARLCGALDAAGFRVTEAEDGVAALSKLDVQRFRMVVVDLATPGFTTRHIVEYLRETDTAPDVLMMPRDPRDGTLPGIARIEAYVPEPVDADEFAGLALRMIVLATRTAQGSASGTYARPEAPVARRRVGTK